MESIIWKWKVGIAQCILFFILNEDVDGIWQCKNSSPEWKQMGKKGIILVSYFCYNKLIKIYLLNPTPINYLTGLKSKVDFTELKSKCWQGWVLSGSYRWKSISLPFPALRSHLHSLTHDLLPPSKPTIANWLSHYIPLTFFHFYRPLWLQWTHLDHSV